MKRIFIFIFSLAFGANVLYAATASLESFDASEYPTIKFKLQIFDDSGQLVDAAYINNTSVKVYENGVEMKNVSINCPEKFVSDSISVLFVVDESGSMGWNAGDTGDKRIEIVSEALGIFFDNMDLTTSEAAIISFSDAISYKTSGFINNRTKLRKAANSFYPKGGTLYKPVFLDENIGAIKLLSERKTNNRKYIIFLSDGDYNDIPSPNSTEITESMKNATIKLFSILMGENARSETLLQEISDSTGGALYVYHYDNQETSIQDIFDEIFKKVAVREPCDIVYESGDPCDSIKQVRIEYDVGYISASATTTYTVPPDKIPRLELSDTYFEFFNESSATQTVTVSAKNAESNVNISIETRPDSAAGKFSVSPNGFSLNPGESEDFKIIYNSPDTEYSFAQIVISAGDGCPEYRVVCVGGELFRRKLDSTIKVERPNGGEIFSSCDVDTIIEWSGVSPEERVKIEHSSDGGVSWELIDDDATGLKYRWNFPRINSPNNLIRVSHRRDSVLDLQHDAKVNCAVFSPDNKRVLTGAENGAFVWDAETGAQIVELKECADLNVVFADYAKSGEIVAVADNGEVNVFDEYFKRVLNFNGGAGVSSADISPMPSGDEGGFLLAIASEKSDVLTLWNLNTGTLEDSIEHKGINGLRFVKFAPMLALSERDTLVTISVPPQNKDNFWEYYNKTHVQIFTANNLNYGSGAITIDYTEDGGEIIAGHFSGGTITVRDSDLGKAENITNASISDYSGEIADVSVLHSDGETPAPERIAAAGADTCYVIDFEGNLVSKLIEHTARINACSFAQHSEGLDYLTVVTASDDSLAKIWDVGGFNLQEDVSDEEFTIFIPDIGVADDFTFDLIECGAESSQIISEAVCNNSGYPATVSKVYVDPAGAGVFSYIGGPDAGDVLQPGECADIEILFTPNSTKPNSAELVIEFGEGATQEPCRQTIALFGECAEPQVISGASSSYVETTTICEVIDSVYVTNNGEVDITLVSISGSSTRTYYNLLSSAGSGITLAPGETVYFQYKFAPTTAGIFPMSLIVKFKDGSPADEEISAIGRGLNPAAQIEAPEQVDFGEIDCGASATEEIVLSNSKTDPCDTALVVTRIELENDDFLSYSLTDSNGDALNISENAPMAIDLGESDSFFAVFDCTVAGSRSATITIRSNTETPESGETKIVLTGICDCPEEDAILSAPILSAKNGDIVSIPITLTNEKALHLRKISRLTAELEFNASMLVPLNQSLTYTLKNSGGKVRIVFPIEYEITSSTPGSSVVIWEEQFRSTLGDAKTTELDLQKALTDGQDFGWVVVEDGLFTNLGICDDGESERYYFADTSEALIIAYPNPGSGLCAVAWEAKFEGDYNLEIRDVFGRKAANLFKGKRSPGEFDAFFDASNLTQGTYFIVLETPRGLHVEKFEAIK